MKDWGLALCIASPALLGLSVMALNASAAPDPPKPCAVLMHDFEPPEGWTSARGLSYSGMAYFYPNGSIVMIYPPETEDQP